MTTIIHPFANSRELVYISSVDVKRIRIANIELGSLGETTYRQISGPELKEFLKALDLA